MKNLISDVLIEALQYRINQERISSYIYEDMANYLDYIGFTGAAKRWRKYASEELTHSGWGESLLSDLDLLPRMDIIPKQPGTYSGLVDIIDKSLEHEITITQQCNELFVLAMKEGCGMVTQLALKYQAEQVEELGKMTYWKNRLEAFGDDSTALRFLDNEMGDLD